MRNVFDQYKLDENRVTHGLMSCLNEDRKLLGAFLRWVLGRGNWMPKKAKVLEQQLPGEDWLSSEEEAERKGLPDGWIYDEEKWCLLIESKIASRMKIGQLQRHLHTAQKSNFKNINILVIDSVPLKRKKEGFLFKEWSEIYIWLRKYINKSKWACRMVEFMEISERRLVMDGCLKEGALTKFSGIPFNSNNPYNYHEAKRILRQLMEILRKDKRLQKLGIDPESKGRKAITGRTGSAIWDYISLKKARDQDFTWYPHFTLSMKTDHIYVLITIPNRIKTTFRKNLLGENREDFIDVFEKVKRNYDITFKNVKGAVPWIELVQRHYKSQRSLPVIDANLAFDLRTAFPLSNEKHIKNQPLWLNAIYDAMLKKRANIQLAIGVKFLYNEYEILHTPKIADHIVDAWTVCKPVLESTGC